MNEKCVAKYIARSSAIASRMLRGEMMIMSALDSTFFALNPGSQVSSGRRPTGVLRCPRSSAIRLP